MPYPSLGFGEDYIETPQTTKRGFIVPVTKEAIFFDRTNLILQRAAEVGEVLGLNKEKRLIDLLIGATNNYKWFLHITHYNGDEDRCDFRIPPLRGPMRLIFAWLCGRLGADVVPSASDAGGDRGRVRP
jgi:hypothetical protein